MLPQLTGFLCSRKTATAAALAAALAPQAAFADTKSASISDLETPYLYVESNGSDYTGVSGLANIVAEVRVIVDTQDAGRVVSWRVVLSLRDENFVGPIFSTHAIGDSYDLGERPRRINLLEPAVIPASLWNSFITTRCNMLADELRAQGLANRAIFEVNRSYELFLTADISANTNGAGSGSILDEGVGQAPVTVVCKKWSGPQIPQAGTNLTVETSMVVNKGLSIVERYGISGVCKIRLDGWITTDRRNAEVSFRYRNQEGKLSQVWTVNTGESRTATFSHWYDIGNNYDPETGQDWAESGFVRIVGVSHDFKTDWAEYTMECVEGGPNTLASNTPPRLKVTFVPQGKVMVHGQICAERLKIVGLIEGRGPSSGHAGFISENGYTFISPPQAYSVSHGDRVLIGADYVIDWDDTLPPQEGELLRIDPRFTFNVTNQNNVVVASLKHQLFMPVCSRPALNQAVQGGKGGLALERPGPLPSGPAAPRQMRQAPQQKAPVLVAPLRRLRPSR
jgi:hypothetical protein